MGVAGLIKRAVHLAPSPQHPNSKWAGLSDLVLTWAHIEHTLLGAMPATMTQPMRTAPDRCAPPTSLFFYRPPTARSATPSTSPLRARRPAHRRVSFASFDASHLQPPPQDYESRETSSGEAATARRRSAPTNFTVATVAASGGDSIDTDASSGDVPSPPLQQPGSPPPWGGERAWLDTLVALGRLVRQGLEWLDADGSATSRAAAIAYAEATANTGSASFSAARGAAESDAPASESPADGSEAAAADARTFPPARRPRVQPSVVHEREKVRASQQRRDAVERLRDGLRHAEADARAGAPAADAKALETIGAFVHYQLRALGEGTPLMWSHFDNLLSAALRRQLRSALGQVRFWRAASALPPPHPTSLPQRLTSASPRRQWAGRSQTACARTRSSSSARRSLRCASCFSSSLQSKRSRRAASGRRPSFSSSSRSPPPRGRRWRRISPPPRDSQRHACYARTRGTRPVT